MKTKTTLETIKVKAQAYQSGQEAIFDLKEEAKAILSYFDGQFFKDFKEVQATENVTRKEAIAKTFKDIKESVIVTGDHKKYLNDVINVYEWYYLTAKKSLNKDFLEFKNIKLLKQTDAYISIGFINAIQDEADLQLIRDYKRLISNASHYNEATRLKIVDFVTFTAEGKAKGVELNIANKGALIDLLKALA